jgi:hypothetical protein
MQPAVMVRSPKKISVSGGSLPRSHVRTGPVPLNASQPDAVSHPTRYSVSAASCSFVSGRSKYGLSSTSHGPKRSTSDDSRTAAQRLISPLVPPGYVSAGSAVIG